VCNRIDYWKLEKILFLRIFKASQTIMIWITGHSDKLFWRKACEDSGSTASEKQGDRIGRIFARWAIVFFGQPFLEKH
jgi:hypothetical protein